MSPTFHHFDFDFFHSSLHAAPFAGLLFGPPSLAAGGLSKPVAFLSSSSVLVDLSVTGSSAHRPELNSFHPAVFIVGEMVLFVELALFVESMLFDESTLFGASAVDGLLLSRSLVQL